MRGKIDKSKVVPGAWAMAKAQQAERFERDPKARVVWERRMARNAEAHVKAAMLEVRDRSGMTQAEIAARMGAEPSNVSRLLHGGGGVNGATFAAFLRACGFGFTVVLVPFTKPRRRGKPFCNTHT